MDEPTTALDVTVEAASSGFNPRPAAGISIPPFSSSATNLGVIARICDNVGVMYAGTG
ncbi:MAG: hypothetical protein R3C44_05810 [Chloroflexota bacterium]